MEKTDPTTHDEYIAACPADVRPILEHIRAIIHEVAPEAKEKISYKMPAFTLNKKDLIYFAAFKKHIGIYPPAKGDAQLQADLAPYQNEKGNLKFMLNVPMPYDLIKRAAKARLAQLLSHE